MLLCTTDSFLVLNVQSHRLGHTQIHLRSLIVSFLRFFDLKSFFTGANLERALQQLLSSSHSRSDSESSGDSSGVLCDFILSAGEIDCREGFTNQISKGMYANVEEAVSATVKAYVAGVRRMLRSAQKGKEGGEEGKKGRNRLRAVYLLPVFPYQRRSKGRSGYHERMRRHRAIILWNHVSF